MGTKERREEEGEWRDRTGYTCRDQSGMLEPAGEVGFGTLSKIMCV